MSLSFRPKDSFPHPELTAIPPDEKPTFLSLKTIHKEMNANAMEITSNRGGGANGHLALTISEEQFNAIPNTQPWITPVHPGPNPDVGANPTAAQITNATRVHKEAIDEFMLYNQVNAALKKQLLAVIPDTYTKALSDDNYGYGLRSTFEILTHLDNTYGTVSQDDLASNLKALHKEWNPTQPIEDLWNQIDACTAYAQPHEPIPNGVIIRAALNNLANTGLFNDDIKLWRKKPAADQTLANLKTEFNYADKERRLATTSASAGYQRANTASYNSKENAAPTLPANTIPLFYCWSHGLGPNSNHTSKLCTARHPGHRDNATADNMLGGCCIIKRRNGERAVYKRPPKPPLSANTANSVAAESTKE